MIVSHLSLIEINPRQTLGNSLGNASNDQDILFYCYASRFCTGGFSLKPTPSTSRSYSQVIHHHNLAGSFFG